MTAKIKKKKVVTVSDADSKTLVNVPSIYGIDIIICNDGDIKAIPRQKVYCRECRYLVNTWHQKPFCSAPRNTKTKSDWLMEYNIFKYAPERLNKNNDCQWYDPETIRVPVNPIKISPWNKIKNWFR